MTGIETIYLVLGSLGLVGTLLAGFYKLVSSPQKQLTKINTEAIASLEGRIDHQERKVMSAIEIIDSKLDGLERDTATRKEVEGKLQVLKDDLKQDINKIDAKLDVGFRSLHERLDNYFQPK